jgi:translation elongation factor P/translation initiation factor 5A
MNKKQTKKEFIMKKIIAFLILSSLMLIGCEKNSASANSPNEPTFDPMKVLTLSYQSSLKKASIVCVEDSVVADFNVGCIYKSENYYFVMNNNSEYELTDINITTNDSNYEVSPSKIASMGAPNKKTGTIPILRVSIKHRSPLNNQSTEKSLARGSHVGTITITGKVNGESFTTTYTVGGTVKTVDITYDNTKYACTISGPMIVSYLQPDSSWIEKYEDNYSYTWTYSLDKGYCIFVDYRTNINGKKIISMVSTWGPTLDDTGNMIR